MPDEQPRVRLIFIALMLVLLLAALDRTIVSILAKGRTATVKGTPHNGKPTTDTYSLAGFGKALALIDEACGVSRPETAAITQAAPAAQTASPQPVAAPAKITAPGKGAPRKASAHKTSHKSHKKASDKKKSTQATR